MFGDRVNYQGKEFNDPIVRCHSCSNLVHRKFIGAYAGCNHCGNKRFRNVSGLNEDEYMALNNGTYDFGLKEYKIDSEFLNQFVGVDDV